MSKYDFHTHTNNSDGLLSPEQLLDRASEQGVEILSITDHDSLESYTSNVYAKAVNLGIRLVSGVEISTHDEDGNRAHILGIGIDPANEILITSLAEQNLARESYAREAIEKIVEGGWDINHKTLLNSDSTITKAHISRSVVENSANQKNLIKEFGSVPTVGTFIETFLIKGKEYYTAPKGMMTAEQAVKVIHYAGGIACYAHPVASLYEATVTLAELEKRIILSGVDAIEAEYVYYAKRLKDLRIDMRPEFREMARRLNLGIMGGSDFHGASSIYGNYVELGFKNLDKSDQDEIDQNLMPFVAALPLDAPGSLS